LGADSNQRNLEKVAIEVTLSEAMPSPAMALQKAPISKTQMVDKMISGNLKPAHL
jgi:hypothetical protein